MWEATVMRMRNLQEMFPLTFGQFFLPRLDAAAVKRGDRCRQSSLNPPLVLT